MQTTIAGLGSVGVEAVEGDEVAALKGDPRMVEVIAAAAWGRTNPLDDELVARTRFGNIRLAAQEVNDLLDVCLAERRSVSSSRERFRIEVVKRAQQRLVERRADGLAIEDDLHDAVRTSAELRRAIDRAWPPTTGAALVRRLLTNRGFLARFADGWLTADEQRLLLRRSAGKGKEAWTLADVALVDEAEAVLGGRVRRYGHLVVDEAQDLSAMAWRMVARRCARFPSLTVLGDLAQATAPGAVASWRDVVAELGSPTAVQVAELEVGYRVPGQILDLANRLLPATGAPVRPSRSVRATPAPPRALAAERADAPAVTAGAAAELLARYSSVAVIAVEALDGLDGDGPDAELVTRLGELDPRLVVVGGAEAKGLEFDAVVVVEPARFVALGPAGVRLLYIALTRAVQELVVVHAQPLPAELSGDGWA